MERVYKASREMAVETSNFSQFFCLSA